MTSSTRHNWSQLLSRPVTLVAKRIGPNRVPTANVVESFINDLSLAEHLTRSNRRLAIRSKITELERSLKSDGPAAIRSGLEQAKNRARQEIARNSSNGVPAGMAELFRVVVEEISLRVLTSIKELKDGTFQIEVLRPGQPLPHAVMDGFRSESEAEAWRDGGLCMSIIKRFLEG